MYDTESPYYPFAGNRWYEIIYHRWVRREVRCQFAELTKKFDTCTIVYNYQYTREAPEQCPHKFEFAVAKGMKGSGHVKS
jgi:hypothetical protein